jgi:hypothetical protein
VPDGGTRPGPKPKPKPPTEEVKQLLAKIKDLEKVNKAKDRCYRKALKR